MTRWFLDTEFNEDGKTIELISIALVSEDGREYYAVSSEFDSEACNEFVKTNVLPLLPGFHDPSPANTYEDFAWKTRDKIASEVRELLLSDGDKPEIWAYFADYDWVALCQLYGPMIALPKGFPFFCMDLKQLMVTERIEKRKLPEQTGAEHDALADARWVRAAHRKVLDIQSERTRGNY